MAARQKTEASVIMREQTPLLNALNCFWLLEGRAVITAAIRWLTVIMFCWNWIYWSMNHSAQVLPNCSKHCGWEGRRRSFPWRSLQNGCARACWRLHTHAPHTHLAKKASSAASSSVVMWRWQGMFVGFPVVFFCFPRPSYLWTTHYLATWLTGGLSVSDWPLSDCCLVLQSFWWEDCIPLLPAQTPHFSVGILVS